MTAPPRPATAASPIERERLPHWDFFWLLVRRDLKVRYAGSTLGGLWNLIHPIVMILIYIVIFSSLMKDSRGAENHPSDYIVHLCSGMLVWLVFAEVLGRSVSTLVENANFLQKVSFPPLILHASILFNVLVIYSVGLLVLWILLFLMGSQPPPAALASLGVMALAGAAASGLGMILSPLHVFFRDTAQFVQIALQVGFWLNPIVYPKSLVADSPLGNWSGLLAWNPTVHFISIAQSLFGDPKANPWPFSLAVILIFPPVCLALGVLAFRKLLPEVRDGL